jgi:RecB family exonuclease
LRYIHSDTAKNAMSNPQVAHSILSFSGRKRWKNCPISVELSKGMTDTSGPAAEEGTCAHTVAEHYVKQHFQLPGAPAAGAVAPDMPVPAGLDLKGATPQRWNETLRHHGRAYRDFIKSLIPAGAVAHVAIEQKVAIASISDQLFGTADCLVLLPEAKRLIVVDYKYGFAEVDVGTYDDPNEQLAAYGVAAVEGLAAKGVQIDHIDLAVYQPRRPLSAPSQTLSLDAIWVALERAKLAREVAAVANPGPPQPGDHCRYCKGKPKCPAVHNSLTTALAAYAGEKSILDMPADDIVQLFAARSAFKSFWEDVEERIEQLVKAGHENLRVKETQGRQMWGDPKAATLTLLAMNRTDLLQPVAISDALPVLPVEFHKDLVKRAKSGRTIQVVNALQPSAIATMFNKFAKGT